MAMSKRARVASESIGFLAIVAGILVALNILGFFFFVRADVTKQKLFSLSDGSKRLAHSLRDNMEITAYFTADLPPPFNATERYVRDILEEYKAASGGKIRVRFVNPDTDERREAASRDGVQKVQHRVLESDSLNVKEGYRGIVFKYLGESKAIPVIEDTTGLEYNISRIIREMSGEKTLVGILSGHGGPTLEKGLSSLKDALRTYELREVQATSAIPDDIKALLIVAPETEIPDAELRNINAYVMNGGSLGIFGGTMKVNVEGAPDITAGKTPTGLNKLLDPWGWRMGENIVADVQCGRQPMQGVPIPLPFPPAPIISFTSEQQEHPAVFRLEGAVLPFVSALNRSGHARGTFQQTVLARSSEDSWLLRGEDVSLRQRLPREWQATASGQQGPFALGVALQGRLPSAFASTQSAAGQDGGGPSQAKRDVRVLVMGTANMMIDQFLGPRQDQQGNPRDLTPFLTLPFNALDWLSADENLIAVRAKTIDDPPLAVPALVQAADKELEAVAQRAQAGEAGEADVKAAIEKRKKASEAWDNKKLMYKLANIAGMPLLLALFGLIRWRSRLARKASVKL